MTVLDRALALPGLGPTEFKNLTALLRLLRVDPVTGSLIIQNAGALRA
jgi:hypothetical protein